MYDSEKYKSRRKLMLDQGRCVCGRPLAVGYTQCQECRDQIKSLYTERRLRRIENRVCFICSTPLDSTSKNYCQACLNNKKEFSRKQNHEIKMEVLRHYGGRCRCCGTDHPDFLAIDHIEGGGTKQREEVGGGTKFYLWLQKNNYPQGFQILCHNCNFSKHLNNGACAHESEEEWVVDMGFDPLVDVKRLSGTDYHNIYS